jgi:hypothetical protein
MKLSEALALLRDAVKDANCSSSMEYDTMLLGVEVWGKGYYFSLNKAKGTSVATRARDNMFLRSSPYRRRTRPPKKRGISTREQNIKTE